ncbi:integrase core domain-containing protein [Piscirickettsia salmonis]|uniref:integrase core domain-containing protein n=1 Tax=Piscirickettsia salmonis TaxID=1238 RepID=UPI0032B747ED
MLLYFSCKNNSKIKRLTQPCQLYIERFWRSIKHEKIKLCEFDDIHELEDLIAEYIHHYNHERPHQALGDFVPAEVFSEAKIIS